MAYSSMYLKFAKDAMSEHRPSIITFFTQDISLILLVKGAEIDASAWLSDIPTSA